MSNKSEPHHKFVQTFVLAEQPNGYFVLNDIFRYLNDDQDEIIADEPAQEEAVVQEEHASATAPAVESEKSHDSITDEAGAEQVDAKLEEVARGEEEVPAADINGDSAEPVIEQPEAIEDLPETTKEVFEQADKEVVDEPSLLPTTDENSVEPEPTPTQTPPKPAESTASTEAPPAKKTWANMVGAKAPALPVLPTQSATVPSQPKPQKSPQPAAPQSPLAETTPNMSVQGNGWQMADHSKKQNRPQPKATTEPNALAYIKNVNEKIHASELRAVLEKYGELKYFDVSRQRVCYQNSEN